MSQRMGDPALMILPAFALLGALFVVPLVWFFIGVLSEESPGEMIERGVAVLSSRAAVTALITTNWIALLVTGVTLLAGYPIAYYLAMSTGWRFAVVLFCIIVPYFTSVIVRTYSWMVLLGRNGLINQALRAAGVTDAPLPLLYNKFGILIGMSYVLMPYMVLTLYAAMRGIDPSLVRAAHGLGASRAYAFWKVYFPLSLHGVVSGSLIVFILAIGFFITPALMGGPLGRDDRDADRAGGRDHPRLAERRLHVASAARGDAAALRDLLQGNGRAADDGSRDVNGRGFLPVYIGLACLVLMAPIVIVCVLAFSGQGYLRFPPESLSLRWFAAFFGDGRWRQSLWSSTMIALIACAISTVLGFFAAYALVRSDMRAKKMMLSFMLLPIIIPHVITAIAMYFLTGPVRACRQRRLDRPLPCRRRAAGGCCSSCSRRCRA